MDGEENDFRGRGDLPNFVRCLEAVLFRHVAVEEDDSRIPLGYADAYMSVPSLNGHFSVKCDVCGAVYSYEPSDVMRVEQDLPESFTPHPLFR